MNQKTLKELLNEDIEHLKNGTPEQKEYAESHLKEFISLVL
jgi:hypothetical protein